MALFPGQCKGAQGFGGRGHHSSVVSALVVSDVGSSTILGHWEGELGTAEICPGP